MREKGDWKLRYGIELEACVRESLGLDVGDYHDGIAVSDYWSAERDSSIESDDCDFEPIEFVSTVFERKDFPSVLHSIRRVIDRGIGSDRFENIEINSTCGAHIHFSAVNKEDGREYIFFRKIPFRHLKMVRENIHSRVKKEMPHIYHRFRRNYNRDFAIRIVEKRDRDGKRIPLYTGNRYDEFYFTTNKAVEWRAFHLDGVNKWSEMEKMYNCAFDALEGVLLPELHKPAEKFSFGSWHMDSVEKVNDRLSTNKRLFVKWKEPVPSIENTEMILNERLRNGVIRSVQSEYIG